MNNDLSDFGDTTDTAPATLGRVTLDDVRAAIGGADPAQTNASKLRSIIGRGSFATIQKHLDTVRAEGAPKQAVDLGQLPEMPDSAAQAMWTTAVQAAQVAVLSRTEKLAAERDDALAHIATVEGDMGDLLAAMDEQAQTLADTTEKAGSVAAAFAAEKETMENEKQNMETQIKTLASELEKEKTNAVHGAAIYESNLALMRSEVARLNNEIGELKSHLYKRAESAEVQPVKKGETK